MTRSRGSWEVEGSWGRRGSWRRREEEEGGGGRREEGGVCPQLILGHQTIDRALVFTLRRREEDWHTTNNI